MQNRGWIDVRQFFIQVGGYEQERLGDGIGRRDVQAQRIDRHQPSQDVNHVLEGHILGGQRLRPGKICAQSALLHGIPHTLRLRQGNQSGALCLQWR